MDLSEWTPTRCGAALILCLRPGEAVVMSVFPDAEAAELADAEMFTPCSPGCLGAHSRVWTEPGRLHVVPGVHDPPPSTLRAASGNAPGPGPECWPAPSILNPPLKGARRGR
jgi:hypothetical protein